MDMDTDKKDKIAVIDSEIQLSVAYANYWSHFAVSQANQSRKVSKGFSGPECTPLEKEQDAFEIALTHLHCVSELIDRKVGLINDDLPKLIKTL